MRRRRGPSSPRCERGEGVWRPRNETEADLAHEQAAAERIERAWDVRAVKLSERLYQLDWAFFRNESLVGWGEYKRRGRRYDTLLLSAAKWMKGLHNASVSGRPFLLFIEWPDGLYWLDAGKAEVKDICLSGNNRGQNGDKEPCVHLDTRQFKKLA